MDNNASESGSRVTRSLRKRLTSVDSDNSSRPGTPVPSKLTAISEISAASPSRSTRMTRRNSITGVSTPVKTPAKRNAASSTIIAENSETVTPARRSTRRRSVSVFENEETNPTGLKTTAFAALDEETTAVEQITTRVTRSQSKSPQQIKLSKTSPSPKQTKRTSIDNKNINSSAERKETPASTQKRRKIGPKSKTQENNNQEGGSDVEISVLSNEMENIKNKSSNIPTIILTDDESNQTAQSNEDKTPQKSEITNTIIVEDIPATTLTDKESNQSTQNDVDTINTPPTNKMSDTTKKVLDQKQIDINVLNKDLNETEIHRDNTNTIVCEKDILYTGKNKSSEYIDRKEDVVNVPNDCDVLNETEENTNMGVDEVESTKSFLKNLESESTTMNEVKDVENVEVNTPLNNKSDQNNENCKTSSHTDNIQSADKNKHTEECETKETANEIITTNDTGEQNKSFDNEIDQKERIESQNLLQKEILNKTNANSSNNQQNLYNEVNFNDIVTHVTEKEKETCKNMEINEKSFYNDAKKYKGMEAHNSDVGINNNFNGSDSNVNTGENIGTNSSITEGVVSESRNKLNVEILATPKSKQNLSSDKVEILSISTLTPYDESKCKAPSKKVDFISSPSNDMTIKNIYPKTPASAKISNSFIEIISSPDENVSFRAEIKQEFEENNESSSQFDQKMAIIRGFKIKSSLDTVQSSTPKNVETLKPEAVTDTSNRGEIKWIIPSVKGTTGEGSKLDVVVTSLNDINACNNSENNESVVQQVPSHKKKSIIFSSEDEEEDNEHLEREGVEENEELAPGEKPYKRKHDFHDDEAMEVDDYESGDSMDSEERREIEDNEIPIDGESIGSHTTEDDRDESAEEEESDNADSFIVSDNEEILQFSDSNEGVDFIDDGENNEHNRKKKKTYKRVQRPADSSSSSEEEEKPEEDEKMKHVRTDNNDDNCSKESPISQPEAENAKEVKSDFESLNKSSENNLNSSKLSDSALRLQCTAESESDHDEEVNTGNEEIMNISRKEILRKLNQSDRFNKSVRDLNPEIDTSPVENCENESNEIKTAYAEQEENSSSSDDSVHNEMNNSRKEQYESHLGEVSVTSESDGDKENQHKSLKLSQRHKLQSGLSVSFGSYKKPTNISKGRQEWQRSFTIDVSVKDGDLVTAVTDIKQSDDVETSSSGTSITSTDERENVGLQSEDIQYLENIRHMPLPLCNPLIRTRRQSLALPTNPDMEICSSSHTGIISKQPKRKSLGVLSNSEFNPSQSFIDSIELQKSELIRQIGKRKRLSKSFCGTSDSLDSSIIDIDVRHLHKRSKLLGENSMVESHHDSIENINSSKLCTKHSSTPHQKKTNENDSNNNIQNILNRCDEILEAANRAKLEAKLNNKKNKGKISKKLRKKSAITSTSDGTNSDDTLRRVSIEIKRKDKIKTVLSQALRAGNAILGNKKQSLQENQKKEECEHESKRLPPEVLKAIEEESSSSKKKIKKDRQKKKPICTTSTSAGYFLELPQTPEKKKKKTFIQLPTGKIRVEPVTPQKRSVQALNGAEFRESPVTPYAVGFKVRQIPKQENNITSSGALKNGKRKRYHDETPKERSLKKSQWTQSGLFIEEEISKNRRITSLSSGESHQNVIRNFKENALMRPEVKRGNKREILLLKERRQMQGGHY